MSAPKQVCAAPGCDRAVPRTDRRGRPAIYCCPGCRPTARRTTGPTTGRTGLVSVEVANPETSPDGRPAGRVWTVRLRRDDRVVLIADDLGWPSANALALDLRELLHPTRHDTGAAID